MLKAKTNIFTNIHKISGSTSSTRQQFRPVSLKNDHILDFSRTKLSRAIRVSQVDTIQIVLQVKITPKSPKCVKFLIKHNVVVHLIFTVSLSTIYLNEIELSMRKMLTFKHVSRVWFQLSVHQWYNSERWIRSGTRTFGNVYIPAGPSTGS